ncbi:MAG: glycyl-radical enzyme activating protein [Promethearchaeota archaeon]
MIESKSKALIFKIQRMSTDDGPGIRTTIYFNKCHLNCVWCHNPESIPKKPQLQWLEQKCIGCKSCVEICPNDVLFLKEDGLHINRESCNSCGECVKVCPSTALSLLGEWWELKVLFHEIEKEKLFFTKSKGGITVSGGEPTLQPNFLLKFFKLCKKGEISTALDTCGYSSKEIYKKLLPYVDLVLLDIKIIDSDKHKEYTGVSNEIILENAKWISNYIKNNGKKLWIRTPLIPKYTATDENIKAIGEFIVYSLNNIPEQWDLLSFNKLCEAKYSRLGISWILKDEPLMTKEEMEHFLELAKNAGVKNVKWSGLTRKVK